jgi:hypothetical protein
MKQTYSILLLSVFFLFGCKKDHPPTPTQPILPPITTYLDTIKEYHATTNNTFFFNSYLFEFEYDEYCAFVFPINYNNKWSSVAVIFEDGAHLQPYATGVVVHNKTKGVMLVGDLRLVSQINCTCDTTYLIGNEMFFEIDGGVLYNFKVSELD